MDCVNNQLNMGDDMNINVGKMVSNANELAKSIKNKENIPFTVLFDNRELSEWQTLHDSEKIWISNQFHNRVSCERIYVSEKLNEFTFSIKEL